MVRISHRNIYVNMQKPCLLPEKSGTNHDHMLSDTSADGLISNFNRRQFLATAATAIAGMTSSQLLTAGKLAIPAASPRLKVAAVFTQMHPRSHAHIIFENFLEKYPFNGQMVDPGMDIVSMYADQFRRGDLTRQVADEYGIPLYTTIADALTLGKGGGNLAVDAVLAIGEHGHYPRNREWLVEYPRKRFFDECVAVMKKSNKFVPYFNDKHLSYRWDWAKEMYDTAKQLGIPMMAGSSVPFSQRIPPMEILAGAEFSDALMIHGGEFENYGIHAMETLQSIVEFRKGGETGISQVEVLYGEELWKAAEANKWPFDLAAAAMELELGKPYHMRMNLHDPIRWTPQPDHGIVITYKDGFKGHVLKIGHYPMRWQMACRLKGESQIRATQFFGGGWQNRNLFKALCHAIQIFFRTRQAPVPVERVLLSNGAVLAAVDAYFAKDRLVKTPYLEFGYAPRDFRSCCESGESWKNLLPESVPEPKGISRPRK